MRQTEYAVDQVFTDRWSPRAMSGERLEQDALMSLFEAARWAPSTNNNQPGGDRLRRQLPFSGTRGSISHHY